MDLVINTPAGRGARTDGWEIRRAAIERGIPCITTMTGASAAARAIGAEREQASTVRSLQELHGRTRAGDPMAEHAAGRRVTHVELEPGLAAPEHGPRTLAPLGRRLCRVTWRTKRSAPTACWRSRTPAGPAPLPGQFYMLAPRRAGAEMPGARTSAGPSRSAGRARARLEFLLEAIGPGTERLGALGCRRGRCGSSARSGSASRAAGRGAVRCSSAAASGSRRS